MASLIIAHNLVKTYDGPQQGAKSVHALQNINFELPEAVFGGLLGPSGSGKTTLLNLIAGLDTPNSGQLWVAGKKISQLSQQERSLFRRENLGFIFQSYSLFPTLSVIENIEYTCLIRGDERQIARDRAQHYLNLVGLSDKKNNRPRELSGGQQQRIAVARALCSEPKLILADEPTANLDSANAKSLVQLFKSLNEDHKVSFLFSTHDARLYDYISLKINLEDGQIKSIES